MGDDEREDVQKNPYQLPPYSILGEVPSAAERVIRGDTDTTGRNIVQTLAEFAIETDLESCESGPVVTRYELVPAPGVKVERIANLSNNLALSLGVNSVRVQAPIPGRETVGIEVPNCCARTVHLREMLEGHAWRSNSHELPVIIGKDACGDDVVVDLAAMPHLLVAGAAGSGKTVCLNTILASLLMSRTPDQLRLMLIDPRIVELAVYGELPHLLGSGTNVISNHECAVAGLRWATAEMERRYKIMARAGVRNIKRYHQRLIEEPDLFSASPRSDASLSPECLPYVVIVINELESLMLLAGVPIEMHIARLGQLARAVGIHMIIATQCPSVRVITGLIKASLPARIAFRVSQKSDSRVVLDANGPEKLLGRGDMLFLPPDSSEPIRAQGALTTDEEIRRIVEFIKRQAPRPPGGARRPLGSDHRGSIGVAPQQLSGRQSVALF